MLRLSPKMISSSGQHSTVFTAKIESCHRDIICKTVEVMKANCTLELTQKITSIMQSFAAFGAISPGIYGITVAPRYGMVQQQFPLDVGGTTYTCLMYDQNLGPSLQQLLAFSPGVMTEVLVRDTAELMLGLVQAQGNPDLPMFIAEHSFSTAQLFLKAADAAGVTGSSAGQDSSASSAGVDRSGCCSSIRFAGYSSCRIEQRGTPLQESIAARAGASSGLPAPGQHMADILAIPHLLVELVVAGCMSCQQQPKSQPQASCSNNTQHAGHQSLQRQAWQDDVAADLQLFLMGGPSSAELQARMAAGFGAGWTLEGLLQLREFLVACLEAVTTGSAAQYLTARALLQHPWVGGDPSDWAAMQAVAAAGIPEQQKHWGQGLGGESMEWTAMQVPTVAEEQMGPSVGWGPSGWSAAQAAAAAAGAIGTGKKVKKPGESREPRKWAAGQAGRGYDQENREPGLAGNWSAAQAASVAGLGQDGQGSRGVLKSILKRQPASPGAKRRKVVFMVPQEQQEL
jgi:hypothetical protein